MSSNLELRRSPRAVLGALLAPLTAAFLLIALPACAQSDAGSQAATDQANDTGSSEVAATIDGEAITVDEVEAEAGDRLQQVEAQLAQCQRQAQQGRYDALNAVLQDMVRQEMVEREAAKAGQTADEYLAANLTIPEVTDADVEAFFNENKGRIGNRTLEQVGPQIRQFLVQQNQQQAEQAFYDRLESGYEVAYQLEPPRVDVEAVGPAKGPADAPITIVEFSDFECPYCSRIVPTLDQVKENYGDQVRLVFRQFPLAMHANAQKAAEASLCAQDQGKFWEMHDAMFANQQQLGVEQLKGKAAELGMDAEQFNQCLDSGKYAEEVQADMQAGVEAGVSGTPAVFINGQMLPGAVPYEQFAAIIDAELKRKGLEPPSSGGSAE